MLAFRHGGCEPAQQLLRLPPPLGPGLGEKHGTPHRPLQLLPAAAVSTCELEVFRRLRDATSAAVPCGPGQSKCPSWEIFWRGVMGRLGGCDPAQQLLRFPSPRSARGSEKIVARPTPHFAAPAHFRIRIQSVPKVAGHHQCRISVLHWLAEMHFAGIVLARWCSSAWRMRASPAAPSLASPARPRARGKTWAPPHRPLQLLPAAAVSTCELEVFRRLRDAAYAEVPCGPGQSKCLSREFVGLVF